MPKSSNLGFWVRLSLRLFHSETLTCLWIVLPVHNWGIVQRVEWLIEFCVKVRTLVITMQCVLFLVNYQRRLWIWNSNVRYLNYTEHQRSLRICLEREWAYDLACLCALATRTLELHNDQVQFLQAFTKMVGVVKVETIPRLPAVSKSRCVAERSTAAILKGEITRSNTALCGHHRVLFLWMQMKRFHFKK